MSGGTIRVLIVDDVAESRDNVEKLLRFEPDITVVGKAARGREGIDLAVALHPDIVLMDLNMPDMDGIAATMEITARVPTTAVIMMSVQNEPDVLRRAMLAGAREFLAKPFSLDELIMAVRHVSRLAPRPAPVVGPAVVPGIPNGRADEASHARIISVVSNKGGVGRTTLATNLAVAIRRATQKQVVLVDAALPFGDVGVMMNVADGKTLADIVPQARSLDRELMEDILVTHGTGVRLLLAPLTPQEAETVTAEHLRAVLALLSKMADYIVVDTRPGFDDTMLSILDASDRILLVLTMEMTAIKDTRQFLEIAELLGYPADKLWLVLNRQTALSGIPAQDIAENLNRELTAKIPDEPAVVLRSVNEGAPLVESHPDHRVAVEINRLAASLVADDLVEGLPSGAPQPGRSSGLVGRLRTAFRHA
ncbi:MAG: response regulator [Sphaerobacter sp.]|nr:response regulator [Sphaerobacter sp.]